MVSAAVLAQRSQAQVFSCLHDPVCCCAFDNQCRLQIGSRHGVDIHYAQSRHRVDTGQAVQSLTDIPDGENSGMECLLHRGLCCTGELSQMTVEQRRHALVTLLTRWQAFKENKRDRSPSETAACVLLHFLVSVPVIAHLSYSRTYKCWFHALAKLCGVIPG